VPRLGRLVGIAVLLYAAVCVGMYFGQRRLLYFPDSAAMDPTAAGLADAAELRLTTPDGERLVAWWLEPNDTTKPVYLYLHGNGANLEARADRFAHLVADGAGLYALSWRGYGGSTGAPTETGLRLDTRTAYDDLVTRVDPSRVLVYGESLGSTLAVMLAADVPVGAVLLDSSFDSALAIAQARYAWLPVRLLLRDTYRADLAAPRVTVPVLQVHCEGDQITPISAAIALHALLPDAQPVYRVPARCHVPSLSTYDSVRQAFVDRVFPGN
jgi:pimeloyl-ACP methyl ester carboxylesterase